MKISRRLLTALAPAIYFALFGGVIGGLLITLFSMVSQIPGFHSEETAEGTLFGILEAILFIVGTYPLSEIAGTDHIWLLPLNLACWGLVLGLVLGCLAALTQRLSGRSDGDR
jgi:hypothetical protein